MKLEIRENINLAPCTTYKIGGPARYCIEAKDEGQIVQALAWARKQSVPFFTLGGGSNILVSDKGFDGLVIIIKNQKLEMMQNPSGTVPEGFCIKADAGVDLPALVDFSINRSFKGLEWASGIPGTFGGAIRGNAGAFGGEIKDIVTSVRFLNDRGEIREISNKECDFVYRGSIFKQKPECIILSATLQLSIGNREKLKESSEKTIEYRSSRHPLEYGSCGSVFKAINAKNISTRIFEQYPRLKESIKNDPFPVVPAACFIDEAGLKGYQIGGAMVSDKHPNFFVNYNQAHAEDVIMLISLAKQRLVDKFGIMAEEEVQLVGF